MLGKRSIICLWCLLGIRILCFCSHAHKMAPMRGILEEHVEKQDSGGHKHKHKDVPMEDTDTEIQKEYKRMKDFSERHKYNARYWKRQTEQLQAKGIAMTAAGTVQLANAFVTLQVLRKEHGCVLPVELFYHGEREIGPGFQKIFLDAFENLTLIDIEQASPAFSQKLDQIQHKGWSIKAHLISLSSFREVLVLDSDSIPLEDPTFLFDLPDYKKAGNLFWPDFWSHFMNPGSLYKELYQESPWDANPEQVATESGQFLFDRAQHEDVVNWIVFLNQHANTVYETILGDKDTYRLAFSLAGKSTSFVQVQLHPAQAMQLVTADEKTVIASSNSEHELSQKEEGHDLFFKHAGMVQFGLDGKMLFLHRTSKSKLNPSVEYPLEHESVHCITAPLSDRQAEEILGRQIVPVSMFDWQHDNNCEVLDWKVWDAAKQCDLLDRPLAEEMRLPIPIFLTADIPGFDAEIRQHLVILRGYQHILEKEQLFT